MGSNKTSLLLVMTILMLRKSLKFNVIGIHSCVPSLLRQVLEAVIPAHNLTECFPRLQRRKPCFEMSNEK